jgi:uncharacterized protein YecE (DUF72 family)
VEQTPSGFRFTVKVSRYLTHVKRLRVVEGPVERFFEPLAPLIEAGKLGAVLWQLPPDFERDDDRLAGALREASAHRNAVEFRHPSWFARGVMELLREHGAALVIGVHPERPFQRLELTADWTLIRFHYGVRGRSGRYAASEIATWRRRIAQWRRRAEVFAYFNNDWSAYAPGNAESLASSFRR